MIRRALPWLVAGVVAIVVAAIWGWLARQPVFPSYLAAWLFWSGVPLGSLLVLLVLEIGAGRVAVALAPAFRLLATGTPLAALLFLPVLFGMHTLYPWDGDVRPPAPFGQDWLHPGFFVGRAIVYLVILSALALLFAPTRPVGARRPAALVALCVYVLVISLAAMDWIMSLDPTLHSGEFGPLIMSAQAAIAVAAAILAMAVAGVPMPAPAASLLAIVSALWLVFQFLQFLVMWSGDLPKEAAWFLMRDADAGRTMEWLAALGGFLAPVVLLVVPRVLRVSALPLVALTVLLAHMAEALWLITPEFRHHFALRGIDVLMMIGLGGITAGLARLRPPAPATAAAPTLPQGAA